MNIVAGDSSTTHQDPPSFSGDHFAYALEGGRYIELRGASASELELFKRVHPGAICRNAAASCPE